MKQVQKNRKKVGKKESFPWGLLPLVAVVLVALIVLTKGPLKPPGMRGHEIGDRAPEISGRIQDGSTVRLSDFKKKVVFLDFWGDW